MARPNTGFDVLQHEIQEEQAATIGRIARQLEESLEALRAFDAGTPAGDRAPERRRLVDAAAYALWNFVVQRECAGFRFTEQVLKQYAIPRDVRMRMGAVVRPV